MTKTCEMILQNKSIDVSGSANRWSPLSRAAFEGHTDTCSLLLKFNANKANLKGLLSKPGSDPLRLEMCTNLFDEHPECGAMVRAWVLGKIAREKVMSSLSANASDLAVNHAPTGSV